VVTVAESFLGDNRDGHGVDKGLGTSSMDCDDVIH